MKKVLKIFAALTAIAIIFFLGWFANALVGNPVSKYLAGRTAEKYLAEKYAGTDYYVEKVFYNFKDGNYNAYIKSPTSVDTRFSLYISMSGKLRWDSYEEVTSGSNTAMRIEGEYHKLADTVFSAPDFPYSCSIYFGTLEIYPGDVAVSGPAPAHPIYAINQNELVLDKVYDIRELGGKAGRLVIYVESDTVTFEAAAEIMVNIKAHFDKAGVPFAIMDFTLQHQKGEDSKRPEGEVSVSNFLYEDIYEEGMVERVADGDRALKEYYAAQDAQKDIYEKTAE